MTAITEEMVNEMLEELETEPYTEQGLGPVQIGAWRDGEGYMVFSVTVNEWSREISVWLNEEPADCIARQIQAAIDSFPGSLDKFYQQAVQERAAMVERKYHETLIPEELAEIDRLTWLKHKIEAFQEARNDHD